MPAVMPATGGVIAVRPTTGPRRHFGRRLTETTPGLAGVGAGERAHPVDESVEPVGIVRTHCKAVDVGAGQVVLHGLPGRAAIGAHLEDVVPGDEDLVGVGAADGHAHGIEAPPVGDSAPRLAAVGAAHDAVVVTEEDRIRVLWAEGQRMEVRRAQHRERDRGWRFSGGRSGPHAGTGNGNRSDQCQRDTQGRQPTLDPGDWLRSPVSLGAARSPRRLGTGRCGVRPPAARPARGRGAGRAQAHQVYEVLVPLAMVGTLVEGEQPRSVTASTSPLRPPGESEAVERPAGVAGSAPASTPTRYALAALSFLVLIGFALYAAYLASLVEEVTAAQPITVPGSGPSGPFGTGLTAPDFALNDLDGKTVRLSDFAGRPVWINIWATWCAPCRAEMPDVDAVYNEIRTRDEQSGRADGLALLLVSIGEDPQAVRRYWQTTGYRLTALVDPTFSLTQRYRVSGLPTHYFIGRDGAIKELAIGGLKPNGMRSRLARISS